MEEVIKIRKAMKREDLAKIISEKLIEEYDAIGYENSPEPMKCRSEEEITQFIDRVLEEIGFKETII